MTESPLNRRLPVIVAASPDGSNFHPLMSAWASVASPTIGKCRRAASCPPVSDLDIIVHRQGVPHYSGSGSVDGNGRGYETCGPTLGQRVWAAGASVHCPRAEAYRSTETGLPSTRETLGYGPGNARGEICHFASHQVVVHWLSTGGRDPTRTSPAATRKTQKTRKKIRKLWYHITYGHNSSGTGVFALKQPGISRYSRAPAVRRQKGLRRGTKCRLGPGTGSETGSKGRQPMAGG
jgi:hypothetical protein